MSTPIAVGSGAGAVSPEGHPVASAPAPGEPGGVPAGVRTYRPTLSKTWWLGNRRYLLFALREFTAVPVALWLLSLLAEIARLGAGPAGYYAYDSPRYVLFSVVCLAFALLHSVTWLNISGIILRVRLGAREVPPRLVTAANYAQWAAATVVVGALLVWLGT